MMLNRKQYKDRQKNVQEKLVNSTKEPASKTPAAAFIVIRRQNKKMMQTWL